MDQEDINQKATNEANLLEEVGMLKESLSQMNIELNTIKINVKKRKSEITMLKILFYTGLFVLLFGFIYTNQTLQRAQYNNLETNISALQNRQKETFFSLEKKIHEEIVKIGEKINRNPQYRLTKSIDDMNRALNALKPGSKKMNKLIRKVQKDSEELRNMVLSQQSRENFTSDITY